MTPFDRLKIPKGFEHYWTKYPQGYTILEALIEWVSQVDKMVDNINEWNEYLDEFVKTFDKRLQPFVTNLINEWLDDGTLADIINQDVFDMKANTVDVNKIAYSVLPGVVGDGETNDTSALQSVIDNLPVHSTLVLGVNQNYLIDTILIKKPITINLNGSTLLGNSETSMFVIEANDVRLENGKIDLNQTAIKGILSEKAHKNFSLSNVEICNINRTAHDLDGGVSLLECDGVYINDCYFHDLYNDLSGLELPHSFAFKPHFSENIFMNNVVIRNCGVGVNNYGSKNCYYNNVDMHTIHNNGYYVQDETERMFVMGGNIENVTDSGFVFNILNDFSNIETSQKGEKTYVTLNGVTFKDCPARGITLRTGSGLRVVNCHFIRVSHILAQSSSFSGSNDIFFSDCSAQNSGFRSFDLRGNRNVAITNVYIYNFEPNFDGSEAFILNIVGCVDCVFENIYGYDFKNVLDGVIRAEDNTRVKIINVEADRDVQYIRDLGTNDLIISRLSELHGSPYEVSGDSSNKSPSMGTRSTNPSASDGEVIGEFYMFNSDTSGDGPSKKVRIKGVAVGNGNTTKLVIEVNGNDAMTINSDGTTSIILPTSPSDVPIGGIFNDSGTPTIRTE